jgi:chemotaxis family two-component system response regulator Rcp1
MSTVIDSRTFHVLLVEDNDADTYLLRKALAYAGLNCNLTILTDGEAALKYVRDPARHSEDGKLDLAILDLNLPRNGGTEVLAALRLHPELACIPVAVMTSSSSPRERAEAEKLGVDQFLTKPPELAKFMELGLILKEILMHGASDGHAIGAKR